MVKDHDVLVKGDRALLKFFKSKAHLLKLKLAGITSFISVKDVGTVQVLTPCILTAAYFL